jgi:hypothetical protein
MRHFTPAAQRSAVPNSVATVSASRSVLRAPPLSTPRGKAVSGISSFRTKAAAALPRPSIGFDNMTYYGGQLMFDFSGNGYGAGGTMYMLWSTDPHLAHPTRTGDNRLIAGPTGQQMHKLLNQGRSTCPTAANSISRA